MKKKIAALALAIYLTGVPGTAIASPDVIANEKQMTSIATSPTYGEAPSKAVVTITEIEDSAGILPDSLFYNLEREIEKLKIAITTSEEKLAALKAEYATERAAEVVIMVSEGEEELASEATEEYIKGLDSAAIHINNAIKAENDAEKTLEALNVAYKRSGDILKSILEKAPKDVRVNIEAALNEQDKAISVINGFHAARKAFFAAKDQLKDAKSELKAAKGSGDAEAIRVAEEKVRVAESLKDELETLKDSADSSKEEVKHLMKQVEKRTEKGMRQIEQATEKMEKLEEKASEKAKKSEEKAKKAEEKEIEKNNKEQEKDIKTMRKFEKKGEEATKKTKEKANKAEEKDREEAKESEETDRD